MTKIATCSYCGTRSILQLRGRVQHELACGSCGAKLHTMKALRSPAPEQQKRKAPSPRPVKPVPNRQKPRRKRRFSDLVEDLWDEVEDIFEDIFD